MAVRFLTKPSGKSSIAFVAALSILILSSLGHSQSSPVQRERSVELAPGKLLVARKEMRDPNFAETVVLITQHNEQGTTGLVVNRRSETPLSQFYPYLKTKNASDLVYSGGPVDETIAFGLLRSRSEQRDAKRLVTDVYLITDAKALDKTVESDEDGNLFRFYVGYCGWAPDQLEYEIGLRAWYVFPGTADVIFDSDPDSIWSRLIRKTELDVAKFMPPSFFPGPASTRQK